MVILCQYPKVSPTFVPSAPEIWLLFRPRRPLLALPRTVQRDRHRLRIGALLAKLSRRVLVGRPRVEFLDILAHYRLSFPLFKWHICASCTNYIVDSVIKCKEPEDSLRLKVLGRI